MDRAEKFDKCATLRYRGIKETMLASMVSNES